MLLKIVLQLLKNCIIILTIAQTDFAPDLLINMQIVSLYDNRGDVGKFFAKKRSANISPKICEKMFLFVIINVLSCI